MITDEQLIRVFRDSIYREADPEYGHSYHQCRAIDVGEIASGVFHIGDSFYGFPIDVSALRENFRKIGIEL